MAVQLLRASASTSPILTSCGRMYRKGKDTYEAAKLVKEKLLVHPEVKAVVYSQHKATLAQRDSVLGLPLPKGATTSGGGFVRVKTPNTNLFDSAYVQSNYHNRQKVGEIVARPHR